MKAWSRATIDQQKEAITQTKHHLQLIQQAIQEQPQDENLHKQEYTLRSHLTQLLQGEESDLRQQARISWLNLGDSNNSFFYKARNARRNRNAIMSIYNDNGELQTGHQVQEEAIRYFEHLLSPHTHTPNLAQMQNFRVLTQQSREWIARPVTPAEIEEVVMSSKNNKAPGIDGFNAEFYKSCWPIIKHDITEAILSFFQSGKMLGELNITSITLVAKKKSPNTFQDYRPISVCKVLYRFISNILANRLSQVLKEVTNLNQHAFIKGRKIHENIALCHELLHNYHKDKGPPRMAVKIDIHKAYDSLNWEFLIHLLHLMEFPPAFAEWIRACITRPHFTVNLNGSSVGYFHSTRGLRQGCPVAPYLFILAMQHFSDLLDQQVAQGKLTPHQHCSNPLITHLTFADDLFIFAKAEIQSAETILQVLDQFAGVSGLQSNHSKSAIFFAGSSTASHSQITGLLGITAGELPVKYLGIPLLSKRLTFQDCMPLLEAITQKIQCWQNTSLSYAGRAELIRSVLMGRILYWISSSFLLPQKVISRLTQLLTRFL